MKSLRPLSLALLALVSGSLLIAGPSYAKSKKTPAAPKFADVEKIFTSNCRPCHSAERHKAGIDLTTYAAVMKGNADGPIIKAGVPEKSFILKALKHQTGAAPMPPRAPQLPDATIKTIEAWIKAGANPLKLFKP